jgi:hypothetical protein
MRAKQTYANEIREEVSDFDRNYGTANVAIPTMYERGTRCSRFHRYVFPVHFAMYVVNQSTKSQIL